MKSLVKLTLVLVATCLSFGASALHHTHSQSSYAHLLTVNAQWQYHQDIAPKVHVSFKSDIDRIQYHLRLVCDYLDAQSTSHLSESQLKNRVDLVASLRGYAERKVFPTNRYHSERTPYFVDDFNVHCAVGYLISVSGHEELVARIRKEHNYDYIADIKTPGLLEWADKHGFTLGELKWIQPAYLEPTPLLPVDNGTNGVVKTLHSADGYGVIVAGVFDSLNAMPCLNIGVYANDQLSCLGDGISGVVKNVAFDQFSDEVVAFGSFDQNGVSYPIAIYDGASWSYESIPGRPDAIAKDGRLIWSQGYEVAIDHPNIPNVGEVWKYETGSWLLLAKVNGTINDAEPTGLGLAYGGAFDSLWTFNSAGDIVDTYETNNVVFHNNFATNGWEPLNDPNISQVVYAIEGAEGGNVYIGGRGLWGTANSVCLTRYLNGVCQPLINSDAFSGFNQPTIYDLHYEPGGTEIIFSGDFMQDPFMGYYTSNLARYNIISGFFEGISYLDSTVYAVAPMNDEYMIGGSIQSTWSNGSQVALNSLARFDNTLSTPEIEPVDIIVSPVPFTDHVTLMGLPNDCDFEIVNTLGQQVLKGKTSNAHINQLGGLPEGIYVLLLQTELGVVQRRIQK